MKKLLLIIGFLILSAPFFAQSENPFFHNEEQFDEDTPVEEQPMNDPGGGGLEGDDPVPIDGYLPVLLITGLAMAGYYTRKKQSAPRS